MRVRGRHDELAGQPWVPGSPPRAPTRGRPYGDVGGRWEAGVPTAGDKPPRYIFSFRHRPSVYNSARFARGEPSSRLIEGHMFVRMTK